VHLVGLLIGGPQLGNECPKCGDWVCLLILISYQYSQTDTSRRRHAAGDILDAYDVIEEIIRLQTSKYAASGSTGDKALDPIESH
jgi:hypothetical protein